MSAEQQLHSLKIADFLAICWQKLWFIVLLTGLFAAGAVWHALQIPNEYKAEVLLAPTEEQQGGGLAGLANQFGSLASMAGIRISGKRGDKQLVNLEIFRSKQFLMGFIERHQLKVPLMAGVGWDQQSGELIIEQGIYNSSEQRWVRLVSPPKQAEPSLYEAYLVLLGRLRFDRESNAGTVKVSLEYYSPVLAQKWLTLLVADLNHYMQQNEKVGVNHVQQKIEENREIICVFIIHK